MTTVQFRDVPGFPGYRVGDDGSVWSRWARKSSGKSGIRHDLGEAWKLLATVRDHRGRHVVKLCQDGFIKRFFVHRLVLEAFVGPCPDGKECCHFPDRDLSNNKLTNLRWGTKQENMADKVVHGTDPAGERNPRARLREESVRQIKILAAEGVRYGVIAKAFGVSDSTVGAAVNGDTWTGR